MQIKCKLSLANNNTNLTTEQGVSALSQSPNVGICNLLALRDVAERAQGTAAANSSSLELLEQNVQDACKLVFHS